MNIKHCGTRDAEAEGLKPQAMRLLKALDAEGAAARAHPFDEERVALRRERDPGGAAVTLGGGEHPRAALDALLARGLAEKRGADFVVSQAGRAFLRREAARREGLDGADAFAAQHRRTGIAAVAGAGRVRVNRDESPLARLASRRGRNGAPLIDAARLQAGERLRCDLTLAGMTPAIGLDWDRFGAGAGGGSGARAADPTQTRIAARQRLARMAQALGSEDFDLLVDLCGFLKSIAEIERARDWPVRSAKVVIARALGRLAEHYGIGGEARGPDHARRILAWSAA